MMWEMEDKEIQKLAEKLGVKKKEMSKGYENAFRMLAKKYRHVSANQIATWAVISAKHVKAPMITQGELF